MAGDLAHCATSLRNIGSRCGLAGPLGCGARSDRIPPGSEADHEQSRSRPETTRAKPPSPLPYDGSGEVSSIRQLRGRGRTHAGDQREWIFGICPASGTDGGRNCRCGNGPSRRPYAGARASPPAHRDPLPVSVCGFDSRTTPADQGQHRETGSVSQFGHAGEPPAPSIVAQGRIKGSLQVGAGFEVVEIIEAQAEKFAGEFFGQRWERSG